MTSKIIKEAKNILCSSVMMISDDGMIILKTGIGGSPTSFSGVCLYTGSNGHNKVGQFATNWANRGFSEINLALPITIEFNN
jgi:hypothetical protein